MRKSGFVAITLMLALLMVAGNRPPETCQVTLQMVDAESGESMAGVIQIRLESGERLDLPELLNHGTGLDDDLPIHDWSVLPDETVVELPAQPLSFEA